MIKSRDSIVGSGGGCRYGFPRSTLVASLIFFLTSLLTQGARPSPHWSESTDLEHCYLLVELCDGAGLRSVTLQMIRGEVWKIYRSAGVEIMWLHCETGGNVIADLPSGARVYIRECLPEAHQTEERTLGYCLTVGGGFPGPAIYVSRRSVEEFLGRRRSIEQHKLARALGRVIAHELAHRFLRQTEHTRDGILKAKFSRAELVDPRPKSFYFTSVQIEFLQSSAISENELDRNLGLTMRAQ